MKARVLLSLLGFAGSSAAVLASTSAPQLSVIQSQLSYQTSFVDFEEAPGMPLLGTLSAWVGQPLVWEFRSTYPDPQGRFRQQQEQGGTVRDWFLPASFGTAAAPSSPTSLSFILGMSLGTSDNTVLTGLGPQGLPDGIYDGLKWSGWGQGATFVPSPGCEPGDPFCSGVSATGFEYSVEILGSASMLSAPDSPVLGPATLAVGQIRFVSLVVRQYVDDVVVGSAGISGAPSAIDIRFTPQGALSISPVPEPDAWMTMFAGLAALGFALTRRRVR